MSVRSTHGIFIVLVSAGLQCANAQQAVSPVERARLHQEMPASTNTRVDANGTALSDDNTGSDDSFGEPVILQSPGPIGAFVVGGDASVFYTNNVALTRRNTIADTFFVANAGMGWTAVIAPRLQVQINGHGSVFRYDRTPALDFQSVGVGAGVAWNPEQFAGVGLVAQYDFIEMLDRHSEEILRDHEFTLGAQKIFPLGRFHSLAVGATLMAGVTEPESAQRDQAGAFLAYRLQATRSLSIDLVYRLAGQFYNDSGRIDCNQIFSASIGYRLGKWAAINTFFSLADNRSDDSRFDYDAVSSGGGLSATIQF